MFTKYAWNLIKFAIIVYVIKKLLNKLFEMAMNKIMFLPNTPSAEDKYNEHNPPGFRAPNEYGYQFEDIDVLTKDNIQLHGWIIYQNKPKEHPTIIFYHGNAGNIGNRLPNIHKLMENTQVNVVIVGYRGYGRSQGSPSEHGLEQDAEAILDWTLR